MKPTSQQSVPSTSECRFNKSQHHQKVKLSLLKVVVFASRSFTSLFTVFSGLRSTQQYTSLIQLSSESIRYSESSSLVNLLLPKEDPGPAGLRLLDTCGAEVKLFKNGTWWDVAVGACAFMFKWRVDNGIVFSTCTVFHASVPA